MNHYTGWEHLRSDLRDNLMNHFKMSKAELEYAIEGIYDYTEDFVQELVETSYPHIPDWVYVDYATTWACALYHDYSDYYDEETGLTVIIRN